MPRRNSGQGFQTFGTFDDESNKFIDQRRSNIKSDLIEITEDKLENILLKHSKKMVYREVWVSPASVFVALIIAQITSTYKNALGLTASVWQAIFLILTIASGIWLVIVTIKIIVSWRQCSIKHLIGCIKASEDESE